MELEALFDAVIVKPLEEEETQYGSIVVPDLGKDRNEHGTVVAVGPGRQVAGVGFVEPIIKGGKGRFLGLKSSDSFFFFLLIYSPFYTA